MVRVDIVYEGGLRCCATHQPSASRLETDAPVDNQGRGESFSPTDLVATALGTCIATTMAIVAERHGVNLTGTQVDVTKTMATEPRRRIGRLEVHVSVPITPADEDRRRIEAAAEHCPVHASLAPTVELPITISWGPSAEVAG